MANTFTTSLSVVCQPPSGATFPAGVLSYGYTPSSPKTIAEQGAISQDLVGATNQNIMPAGIANAVYVYLRVSAPVTFKITSAAGVAQVIPVDEVLFLLSSSVPITAITVTGTAQIEGIIAGS